MFDDGFLVFDSDASGEEFEIEQSGCRDLKYTVSKG